MRRSTRIRLIAGTVGGALLAAALLWLILLPPPRPAAQQAPPRPIPAVPPPSSSDSIAMHGDSSGAIAAVPATPEHTAAPGAATTIPSPDTSARILPGPDTAAIPADIESLVPAGTLIVPVAGIRPDQLQDTYDDARSEGRVHNAIDIMAPEGSPVLAAADGKIVKLFNSERGGTTIYELAPNNRVIYYYAHLERYADGLLEGASVKQGDVIAYVGDTGNAGPGNYHLHFEISITKDPRQYWGGTPINPYPILRHAPTR